MVKFLRYKGIIFSWFQRRIQNLVKHLRRNCFIKTVSGWKLHCVKSVRIQSYSGPYFPTFGLNKERYGISPRIQAKWGKKRTRIIPNTDSFYAVLHLRCLTELSIYLCVWQNNSAGKQFNGHGFVSHKIIRSYFTLT